MGSHAIEYDRCLYLAYFGFSLMSFEAYRTVNEGFFESTFDCCANEDVRSNIWSVFFFLFEVVVDPYKQCMEYPCFNEGH